MIGCDNVDSLAARVHYALRSDCPCCTFWRGVLLGAALGGALAVIAINLL